MRRDSSIHKSINSDEPSYRQSLLDDERALAAYADEEHAPPCTGWFLVSATLFALTIVVAAAAFVAAAWSRSILTSKATFSCSALSSIAVAAIAGPPLVVLALFLIALPLGVGRKLRRFGAARVPSCAKKLCAFGAVNLGLVVLLVAVFGLGAISGLVIIMSKTVPSLTGQLTAGVAGLDGPIQIVRDDNGITHVRAATQRDALFGQGFVHAQDRLWEMEFQRLAVQGRLAEHLGSAALKFDKQTRTLNFVAASSLLCSNLTADETRVFQHYIDGINFYLKTVPERPPEFLIMSKQLLAFHEPEPYTIMDACYAARLMQWRLSLNVNEEIDRFNIFWKTNRTYEEIWELYANQTNITNTVLTAEQLNITEADAVSQRSRERNRKALESSLYSPGGPMYALREAHASEPDSTRSGESGDSHRRNSRHREQGLAGLDLRRLHRTHASNAWVARTGFASPCQASDPHLEINLPSIWYYVHLSWGSHDFAGVGLVGLPAIHIGKSAHVSWGITMSMTDLIDLFLLVPSPTRPETHYIHNNAEVAYNFRQEVIKVKGGDDIVLTVKDSLYGPVATEALGLPRPDILHFAVSGRALQPDNSSVHAVYNMINPNVTTAMDVRDMIFANMQSPGFSIPATDRFGNLVYLMTGSHVERAEGHTGFIPTLGNGTFDWVGFIPYEELPTLVIPATTSSGAISAANQKIYPDGYRHFLGYDYALPDRGGRLHQLVNTSLPVNLSDVRYHIQVQTDVHSNLWGLFFKPLFLQGVDINGRPVPQAATFRSLLSPNGQQWYDSLTTIWDGKAVVGSYYESFMVLWYRELTKTPQDVLQALDVEHWDDSAFGYFLLAAPTRLKEAQCAARATQLGLPSASNSSSSTSSCLHLAADLWSAQAAQYSPSDVDSLPIWGVDLNNLHATNLMLTGTPLACFLDRVVQKDGDWTSIDVADPASIADDIKVTAASSMRQVYSWATPESIHFALPGGESGNPFSPRYQNLLLPFVLDQYISVTTEGGLAHIPQNASVQEILP